MKLRLSCLWLVALAACSGADGDDPTDGEPGGVTVEPAGDVPPFDNPAEPVPGAGIRRLTVDQLRASVPVVAGAGLDGEPIRWMYVNDDGVARDAYDDRALGKTLGRPDYVVVTEEDPAPTSLYVKLASDMARSVCDAIVTADLGRAGAETLWRGLALDGSASDEALRDNAKLLALRFLGLSLAADDEMIDALVTLHQAAAATAPAGSTPAAEGWRAVCIALFEDPAFHLK